MGEEYPGETQYAATIHYDPPRPTRLTMIHHAPPRPTTPHHAPPGGQLALVGGAEATERRAPRAIDRAGYCGRTTDIRGGSGWRPSGSNWSTVPQELWWALPRRAFGVSFSTRCEYYLLLTTDYLLLLTTTHFSLLTTHYSLLTTHYSLLTTHYSLLTTHYSLLTTHYSLLTTHYVHLIAGYY